MKRICFSRRFLKSTALSRRVPGVLPNNVKHWRVFKVADAEVEYKNVSIEGPSGTIRTSALGIPNHGSTEVSVYVYLSSFQFPYK